MRTNSMPASRRRIAATIGALVATFAVSACGKAVPPPPSKPSQDFRAAAKTAIDAKNMGSELDKLKQEIDADSK